MAGLPEHVARNRAYWGERAREYVAEGRASWERDEPRWGIFGVPESEVGLLPAELAHNSEAQLASAREFQGEFGIEFPLLHGNAEEFPFPDASFDLAISEYGARRPLG